MWVISGPASCFNTVQKLNAFGNGNVIRYKLRIFMSLRLSPHFKYIVFHIFTWKIVRLDALTFLRPLFSGTPCGTWSIYQPSSHTARFKRLPDVLKSFSYPPEELCVSKIIKISPQNIHVPMQYPNFDILKFSTRLLGITTEFVGLIPRSLVLRSIVTVLGWILIGQLYHIKPTNKSFNLYLLCVFLLLVLQKLQLGN